MAGLYVKVRHTFQSLNRLTSASDGEFGRIFMHEISLHLVSMNVCALLDSGGQELRG